MEVCIEEESCEGRIVNFLIFLKSFSPSSTKFWKFQITEIIYFWNITAKLEQCWNRPFWLLGENGTFSWFSNNVSFELHQFFIRVDTKGVDYAIMLCRTLQTAEWQLLVESKNKSYLLSYSLIHSVWKST